MVRTASSRVTGVRLTCRISQGARESTSTVHRIGDVLGALDDSPARNKRPPAPRACGKPAPAIRA